MGRGLAFSLSHVVGLSYDLVWCSQGYGYAASENLRRHFMLVVAMLGGIVLLYLSAVAEGPWWLPLALGAAGVQVCLFSLVVRASWQHGEAWLLMEDSSRLCLELADLAAKLVEDFYAGKLEIEDVAFVYRMLVIRWALSTADVSGLVMYRHGRSEVFDALLAVDARLRKGVDSYRLRRF